MNHFMRVRETIETRRRAAWDNIRLTSEAVEVAEVTDEGIEEALEYADSVFDHPLFSTGSKADPADEAYLDELAEK